MADAICGKGAGREGGWFEGGVKTEKVQDALRKERGAESEVKGKAR